ncbi:MAG: AI-2E family transporter [Planctomycetota bacterium]|nr:AI-2E family transporter [Planctomycetota bacterium]
MIDRLSPAARNAALAVLVVLVGWFLWSVRAVLNPLILGYLLAFVLHPLVLSLEKRGWKRSRAVNVIFFGAAVAFTLLALVVWWQGHGLALELVSDDGLGAKVRVRLEQALHDHRQEIDWLLQFLPGAQNGQPGAQPLEPGAANDLTVDRVMGLVREWWASWLTEEQQSQATSLGWRAVGGSLLVVKNVFGSVFAFLGLVVLLPIYTYFLLFELERIHRFVQRYMPNRDRERLTRIGGQIGEVLANFFRGRLLVCFVKGIFLTVGLFAAQVDYALLIGMGTGFLTLIPFVGSVVGFALALAVSMIEHSVVSSLVRVGIVFMAGEALENYVLLPKILGNSLGLHPIVVLFSLMAGAASMGMFGLLIALPLTATIVILAREFVLPVLAQLADQDGRPDRPKV